MNDTITRLDEGYRELKMSVHGDGNGRKGLVRRLDFAEQQQAAAEKRWGRIENLVWAVLTAVIISAILQLMPKPTPQQTVSQSVSTAAPDGMPVTAFYTTPQLASLLGYSDREIQDRASKGEIPGARKDGKAWRFDRPSVDSWLAAKAASTAKAATSADAPRDQ
jgi:excisionase family DNA binding protein